MYNYTVCVCVNVYIHTYVVQYSNYMSEWIKWDTYHSVCLRGSFCILPGACIWLSQGLVPQPIPDLEWYTNPKWHVRKWRTVWRHGVLWCLSAIVLHEWSMWLKWQGRHHNVWHYTMKIQHLPYTISTLPTAIWPTNLKYTVRIYADPVQSSNALIVLYTYWTRLWSEFTMGEMPHTLIH